MRLILLILLLLAFAVPAVLRAESAAVAVQRYVAVVGEADAKLTPDQAVVQVEIATEDKQLAAAQKAANEKVSKLLEIAEKNDIKKEHLKTLYSSVSPVYDYTQASPDGTRPGKRIFRHYTVSHTVQVTVPAIDRVGALLDAFTTAGFDRINNVSFSLKDEKKAMDDLSVQALANAKDKATRMAAALGQKIGKPLVISESGGGLNPPPYPMPMMKMAMAAPAESARDSLSTGVPAGQVEVHRSVSVTFELE